MIAAAVLPIVVLTAKVVVAVLLSRAAWTWWWNRKSCPGADIPGDMGWPLIGDTVKFFFLQDPRTYLREMHAKHGPVFKSHILGRPSVFLCDNADIKKCLLGEDRVVIQHMFTPMRILTGEHSLLSQHGEEHFENRSMILRALRPDALQSMIPLLQNKVQDALDGWIRQGGKVDVYEHLRHWTFAMAQTIVLGEYSDELNKVVFKPFHTLDLGTMSLPINLPWTQFGKAMAAKDFLNGILGDLILEREAEYLKRDADDVFPGLLGSCLARRREKGISGNRDLIKSICQLQLGVGAASSTTTAGCVLTLNGLARHPELQEVLYAEQLEVFGDGPLPPLELAHFKNMPKLDSAIREMLRQQPTAMLVPRLAIKSFEAHTGNVVPNAWAVWLSLDTAMTQTGRFDAIDEFLPMRYLKDSPDSLKPQPFEDRLFGGGQRMCPGKELALMELKVIVTLFIHYTTFGYPAGEEVHVIDNPTPAPAPDTPMALVLTPRRRP